jgi:hypothetical protein
MMNSIGRVSRQLVEQRFGVLQDRRVKPFGEPAVNWGEEITGFGMLALVAPATQSYAQVRDGLPPSVIAYQCAVRCIVLYGHFPPNSALVSSTAHKKASLARGLAHKCAASFILPSTVVRSFARSSVLRHRFPHHDSKAADLVDHEFAGRSPPCSRRAEALPAGAPEAARDLASVCAEKLLGDDAPDAVPCNQARNACRWSGVWRRASRVIFATTAAFRTLHSSRRMARASSPAIRRGLQSAASGSCW